MATGAMGLLHLQNDQEQTMSDNYQAIYDAVRSRFSNVDANQIIREHVSMLTNSAGHALDMARANFDSMLGEHQRPSVLYRPTLTQDGDHWLAIYGDLQSGVVGAGRTPAQAMQAFDQAWHKPAVAPPKLKPNNWRAPPPPKESFIP
jgi:hypothetical protein